MKAYQLIHAAGPDVQKEVIGYLQTEQRGAFRAAVDNLAVARKLRPVFMQKKSKEQQAAWLLDQIKLKMNDGLAEQVLQIWLLKGKPAMLITFLDAVGIKHDGKGEVEDLPETIEEKKAKAGIDALLKDNPPAHVAMYLHLFQMQKEGGWTGLTEAMKDVPEIQMQVPA